MPNPEKRPPVVLDMHVEGFADSRDETLEIDRDEWDAMTPEQRVALADRAAEDFAVNYVGWGWNIANPVDYAAATGEQVSVASRSDLSGGAS